MNEFNPNKSSLARLVDAANVELNKNLYSAERTVITHVEQYAGSGVDVANATAFGEHDRYGDDYPGVSEIPDDERYSSVEVDFSQTTLTPKTATYYVNVNNSVVISDVLEGINRRYGTLFTPDDITATEQDLAFGYAVVQISPNSLMYAGSFAVHISVT